MGCVTLTELFSVILLISGCLRHGVVVSDAECNSTGTGSFIPTEKILLKCLLRNYEPIVRPSLLANQSVAVTVDSYTADILELDEKSNVLTTFLRLCLSWTDVQLRWNREDFPGVTDVSIPINRIWTPEIEIHNSVGDDVFGSAVGRVASVDYHGFVTWRPHGRMRSHCPLDLARFPFDSQTCQLWIGPGSYDSSLVNVTLAQGSKVYRPFVPMTPEWDIDGYTGYRAEEVYGNKIYSSVVFEIQMTRKLAFFQNTLLGPSIVLAILTLCLFSIPVDSSGRFTMAAAILVSNVLLVVLSNGYLPTDIAQLPTVAKYVGFNLSLITLAVVISIVAVNLHRRDVRREPVPGWMRTIFLRFLSRLLCLGTVQYVPAGPAAGATTPGSVVGDQCRDREMRHYLSTTRDPDDEDDIDSDLPSPHSPSSRGRPPALDQTLADIRNYLGYLTNECNAVRELAPPSHRDLVTSEWQQVARIIDRLSLFALSFMAFVFALVMY